MNNQPLPPAISVIVQPLGLMRKVTMVTEMEAMHGLDKMSYNHQGWQGYSCWWIPDMPLSGTNYLSSHIAPFLQWNSQWDGGRLTTLHYFMEMTTLCPYWCRNLFWLWVCLTACNAYAKSLSVDLQNTWPIIMVFHTILLLTKEFTSQIDKGNSGPIIIESTGLTMLLTILKKLPWYKAVVVFLWHS